MKKSRKCIQTVFFGMREDFEISVFEITIVICTKWQSVKLT